MISEQLKQRLLAFRDERDWKQFHNLRTLSVSIALEAAELMELTQWARDDELERVASSQREALGAEIADLVILFTYLAHDLQFDLETEVGKKLEANARKYPVELARGNARKYDKLGAGEQD